MIKITQRSSIFFLSLICLLLFISSLQANSKLSIPTVLVEDINNPPDFSNPACLISKLSSTNPLTPSPIFNYGSVTNTFHIGTFDTTASQYMAFLNAVAKEDPNHLYDERMSTDKNVASIARSGSPGNYTYVIQYPNPSRFFERPVAIDQLPIVYVSWFSAVRFCNWLHNGQPSGKQDSTTTEKGAYDLTAPVIIKHLQPYCDFLNAVAKNDPHGLYESTITSFITRQGEAGGYLYSLTDAGKEKGAKLSITWTSAARFANWKKNKTSNTPGNETSVTSTTPDDLTEKGFYTISEGIRDLVGDIDIQPTDYCKIAEGAHFFLPSEDQYYKAAFYKRNHDANNQLTDEYWMYPTQSNFVPGNTWSLLENFPNNVNYYIADHPNYSKTGWFDKSDYRFGNYGKTPFITPVGAYDHSPSPYGAYDMGGNVSQWLNGPAGIASAVRPIRGGGWGNENQWPTGPDQLSKNNGAASIEASVKRDYIGFRIATP